MASDELGDEPFTNSGYQRPVQPLRPDDLRQLGEYRLMGRLGEGGMGRVYLGRSTAGRHVAVKLINRDIARNDESRRRFRREVARAKQVPPFSTAEVLDADPDHDPPYLVVELVNGPSLVEVVEQHGPLSAANLHGVALGIAAALSAIHDAGVIHRDLKPSNVLLPFGSPKVIDFGIASPVGGASTLTAADRVVGTLPYMAPERLYVGDSRSVTAAADIFAWGAVVTFAGTGRIPFYADSANGVLARIIGDAPDLGGLVDPVRGLVEAALAKDPAKRPTARQLVHQLAAADAPTPDATSRTTASGQRRVRPAAVPAAAAAPGQRRAPRRSWTRPGHRRLAAIGAVALLTLAVSTASVRAIAMDLVSAGSRTNQPTAAPIASRSVAARPTAPRSVPASQVAPPITPSSATTSCPRNGSALRISPTYNWNDTGFGGATTWRTRNPLPDGFEQQLNQAKTERDLESLLSRYDAVKAKQGLTVLKLVLQGRCADHVVIRNFYSSIRLKAPPYAGSNVIVPAGLGILIAQGIVFDLDRPDRSPGLSFDAASGKLGQPWAATKGIDLEYNEVAMIQVFAFSKNHYVEWDIVIDTLVGGEPEEFTVSPNNAAIRTTAPADSYQSTYSHSMDDQGFTPVPRPSSTP